MTRVVILGGGFGGVYAALGLDKVEDIDVTLVSRDNFFLFTPMLSEVATSAIDTRHIVNPIRRLFRRVRFVEAEVESIDRQDRAVTVRLPTTATQTLAYDQLVIALGSVTNYFGLPGVEKHSLPVKTLADAIVLRNRVIQRLEEASVLPPDKRGAHLTFVVAGGNLSGVEVTGDLNDFLFDAADAYPSIGRQELRVVLLEAGPRLMPQLSSSLAEFTRRKLTERGVEVHLDAAVEEATAADVAVSGLGRIATRNLIWTAGVAPPPLMAELGLPLTKGRIVVDQTLRVQDAADTWAVGDAALIQDGHGGFQPQTAQHAVREGSHVAGNIRRVIAGQAPRPFRYGTLGMLATVGHRAGVGQIFGIKISGFPAWWAWRSYYLLRLPRLEKRVRVALDWTLDLFFPRDIVELKMVPTSETGEEPADESSPAGVD